MQLSHFAAAILFAFFASIIFGITQRTTSRDMIRYGAYCFSLFVAGTVLASWVMWILKR